MQLWLNYSDSRLLPRISLRANSVQGLSNDTMQLEISGILRVLHSSTYWGTVINQKILTRGRKVTLPSTW